MFENAGIVGSPAIVCEAGWVPAFLGVWAPGQLEPVFLSASLGIGSDGVMGAGGDPNWGGDYEGAEDRRYRGRHQHPITQP